MIDLTQIFQAVIALLAALITYKLIPWIKSKTTEQQQYNIDTAARIAVYAAEQFFGAGQGAEKLEMALDTLRRAGFDVNAALVRGAIEKAVYEMNLIFHAVEKDEKEQTPDENQSSGTEKPVNPGAKEIPGETIFVPGCDILKPVTQGGDNEPPDGGKEAEE